MPKIIKGKEESKCKRTTITRWITKYLSYKNNEFSWTTNRSKAHHVYSNDIYTDRYSGHLILSQQVYEPQVTYDEQKVITELYNFWDGENFEVFAHQLWVVLNYTLTECESIAQLQCTYGEVKLPVTYTLSNENTWDKTTDNALKLPLSAEIVTV